MTTGITALGNKNRMQTVFSTTAPRTQYTQNEAQVSCFGGEINVNGCIDAFEQGEKGDCFLLAALVSISNNKKGAEILKKNIKKNPDGSVTVTFPGLKIYNKNSHNDLKIPESYTITPEAFARAREKGKHSTGDDDVLVYELAFAKFRRFVMNNPEYANDFASMLAPNSGTYVGGADPKHALEGGCGSDAMFLLTGYSGHCYFINSNEGHYFPENPRTSAISRTGGEAPALVAEDDVEVVENPSSDPQEDYSLGGQLRNMTHSIYRIFDRQIKGNNLMDIPINQSEVLDILIKFLENPSKFMVTVGVEYPEGLHELSLKSVTPTEVVLINPWNSEEEVHLSLYKFLNKVVTIDVISTSDNLLDDMGVTDAVRKTGRALDAGAEAISNAADQVVNALFGWRRQVTR